MSNRAADRRENAEKSYACAGEPCSIRYEAVQNTEKSAPTRGGTRSGNACATHAQIVTNSAENTSITMLYTTTRRGVSQATTGRRARRIDCGVASKRRGPVLLERRLARRDVAARGHRRAAARRVRALERELQQR